MSQDDQLKQAVLSELNWEPSIDSAHIGVTAKDGVVTLLGHVATYGQKRAAETAARRVKGVSAIAEEIEVKLPFQTERGDDDIAAAVVDRLGWDTSIPRDAVKVRVEKGWVTLTGEVEWYFQKSAAESEIAWLMGVVGVSNQISIKVQPDTGRISDEITHALHRSWLFDAKTINVSASGGHIRLTGTVRSPHERQVAATTAWAAPGATAVENELRVV
ncbi:BON domain-containing protein [Falsiroseomonas selenitidurans]|uniref:BON domain-containing protein n=1 Tax=Falsiroseomonas selenitidurans TaxID=2716335 RepID=A0ABX1E8R1_9PROT|nr:BON domain-containing protein [Falsiroseomonas selenitidurans]NKC33614.1 BON domain-containing protein [Falsiroseomonas selenitidurans]